ncbi:HlyD family efflux transporter periplasmic adaptor subunit [Sphingomonas colocasiae]|uniref:HlyD family efflux transporter periplasmic adaptor subunit n=1 Tax=Sphingomonas colocasiae TaxID=1848973 RepID=UPI0031BB390B
MRTGFRAARRNVFGIALLSLLVVGCGGRNGDDDRLELTGNVDVRQVSLAFEQTGRIAELGAQEGDMVKAGAVLGLLDTVTLKLQAEEAKARVEVQEQSLRRLRNGSRPQEIAQAAARLASAEAEARRAADELARLQGIAGDTQGRGVAGRDMDAARKQAAAANAAVREQAAALSLARQGPRSEDVAGGAAQLGAARAQLALLQHQIGQGVLRAPVDGVIRARLLEPGDIASPQKPVFEIARVRPKWVRAYVEQPDLGRIRPGMAAGIVSDSQPDRPIAGRIGYISSVAEFTPKTVQTQELRASLVYEIRVTVDDPDNRLRLGQPVTVRIDLAGPKK